MLETRPHVDIVLATNRRSPYLTETISSIRSQTYPNWRLIVVDDGSPDPAAVRHAVAGVPGVLVLRREAAGLPASRNAGIRAGSSPLIALVDDDDVWAPEKLEQQVAGMTEDPDAVACYSGGWYMDGVGATFGDGWAAVQGDPDDFVAGTVEAPRIVTLVVRREAWSALGGFNESYSLAEDYEFILRLAMRGRMRAVAGSLVGYRRHDHNMSAAGGIGDRAANKRLLIEQLARARAAGDQRTAQLLAENLQRRMDGWVVESASRVLRAGRRGRMSIVIGELFWLVTVARWRAPAALFRTLSRAAR